jgi:acetyl-CoA carboxylase biotin carboxyl carrier protein
VRREAEPADAGNGSTAPASAPTVLARLAEDVLPTLIARLDRSRLGELEVRHDGWRIRLRRGEPTLPDAIEATTPLPRRGERRTDRPTADRPSEAASDGRLQQLRPPDRGHVTVNAPAVGYYAPRDGLAIGASVRAGDLLGHVDVLGVRQDVVAPEDGLIAAMDAEPGEAVEYGQPLARLERAR